ncbi:Caspase-6 [Merluccius polli]|uniref:Caspase-6 n=1 Tax=Merluccius polli TaxID=89951 RepID=A0AA47NXV1_MERPO|nr:Caspase-6 [Merluccius polli]
MGYSDISLEKYKMDHKRRGLALIFNQENFHWELRMKPRCGTDADRRNLEERYHVSIETYCPTHTDLKKEKVLEKIREAKTFALPLAAEADHVDEDCFVCVFLTHGEEDMIYAHDEKFSIKDITAFFKGDKCQSLVGKPKIFILQACRGEEYDNAVTGMAAGDSVPEENQVVMNAGVVHTLPAGADFLMCYSVGEGYYSFRDTVNGSWYIQDLCQTLQRSAGSLEFLELLTLVNMKVSRAPSNAPPTTTPLERNRYPASLPCSPSSSTSDETVAISCHTSSLLFTFKPISTPENMKCLLL